MSAPLIRLSAIEWAAGGRRILGPLDLEVAPGECIAVVGPNGAGKTTLLRLVSGLVEPSAGSASWRDEPLAQLTRRTLATRIAYVPQIRPSRIPLTVEQAVLLGRYPYLSRFQLAPSRADFDAVGRALAQVGLEGLRERSLDRLSGGERQAVFIAAALAQEAELLVLDEPTTHLDPSHQREIARLIRSFNRDLGRTVLTATHDLNFASLVADRIVALREGQVLACEPPQRALTPELLERLFEAPFEVVREGARPMTMLELDG
jgi:iron complex transport system ATP-binding protein